LTLKEIMQRLKDLKERGYIPSLRRSSTGIGFTFEKEMGLQETNIPIPDLGGRVEIKTARRGSASLVTLFCFNKGVWKISQKELIEKYGYVDQSGRRALKNTLFVGKDAPQNLSLKLDSESHKIELLDEFGKALAIWEIYIMVSKLVSKLNQVLFVIADRQERNDREEFWYNEAYLLREPSPQRFIEAFKAGKVGIDLRMHLRPNGTVRNRGTAFRAKEADLKDLYSVVKRLDI